jgi:uncharacterized damage-inducible protein DinB
MVAWAENTVGGNHRSAYEGGIMKNFREYYKECFEAEKPKFVRVISAVPADQAAYRPHPRSTSAGDIVWLLASELHDACELIDRGELRFAAIPAPPIEQSIAAYEENAAALEARLAKLDDARWDGNARFLVEGKVAWETSLGDMLFGFLFDAIHHRGQLSSYLRPMGAKVPAIYGPSGDDPGM